MKLAIVDQRQDITRSFKELELGEVFEYLESIYIKTGVSVNESNAVDFKNGAEDIIRLDAEVKPLRATLVIESDNGEENW